MNELQPDETMQSNSDASKNTDRPQTTEPSTNEPIPYNEDDSLNITPNTESDESVLNKDTNCSGENKKNINEKIFDNIINEGKDDLINQKKKLQASQNVDNNSDLENQYNIAGNQYVVNYNIKPAENDNVKVDKENIQYVYKLDEASDFNRFISEMQSLNPFVYAIILSLFDITPINNLVDMVELLQKMLPQLNSDLESNQKNELFVSQGDVLYKIRGEYVDVTFKTFLGDIDYQCVRYCEEASNEKIILNIWNSFPHFRATFVSWLLDISKTGDKFIFSQVIVGLQKLITVDFGYGIENIIPIVLEKCGFTFLYQLILSLYKQKKYDVYIDRLMQNWLSNTKQEYWKIPYNLYIEEYIPKNEVNYEKKISQNIENVIINILDGSNVLNNLVFCEYIGQMMTYSSKLCLTVSKVLAKTYFEVDNTKKYKEKDEKSQVLSLIFCTFIKSSYLHVTKKNYYLALVANTTKEDFANYKPILRYIMLHRNIRNHYLGLLGLYLDELDSYLVDIGCLKRFFSYLAFMDADRAIYDNVILFLKACIRMDCKTAKKVFDFLNNLYNPHADKEVY